MTEAEWLACLNCPQLLNHLEAQGNASGRKLRLFVCACLRRIWPLLVDESSRKAIWVAEDFADGQCYRIERTQAKAAAIQAAKNMASRSRTTAHWNPLSYAQTTAAWAAGATATVHRTTVHRVGFYQTAYEAAHRAAQAMGLNAIAELPVGSDGDEVLKCRAVTEVGERAEQAKLLRHVIGNPFRSYATPTHWPTSIIQLADSLYHGADCSFALHDALLEAGHAGLAEHFREPAHPKGCWALDLILGKQ